MCVCMHACMYVCMAFTQDGEGNTVLPSGSDSDDNGSVSVAPSTIRKWENNRINHAPNQPRSHIYLHISTHNTLPVMTASLEPPHHPYSRVFRRPFTWT